MTISLADGTRTTFSGDITQVAMLGSEGGLARYRVRLMPWLWRLTQVLNSRVWQDKSVIDIVDDVLGAYPEEGLAWRVEETDDGHGLVLFANSSQETARHLAPKSLRRLSCVSR